MTFKRGDSVTIELQFVSGFAALSAVVPGREIVFGIKPAGQYGDGDFIVTSDTYTATGNTYLMKPSFNTVELNDLLNAVDNDSDNDLGSVTGNLEVTWSDNGSDWYSTNTIPVTIQNDLISGNESTALEVNPSPLEWLETYRPSPLILSAAPISIGQLQVWRTDFYYLSAPSNVPGLSITLSDVFNGLYFNYSYDITAGSSKAQCIDAIVTSLMSPPIYEENPYFTDYYSVSSNGDSLFITRLLPAANDTDFENNFFILGDSKFNVSNAGTMDHAYTITPGSIDGTPGVIGQDAIVNETDIYKCTQTSPKHKWVKLN